MNYANLSMLCALASFRKNYYLLKTKTSCFRVFVA